MTNVEIITIGDELLIGQVIDTNSAWMAQELNKVGFDVLYKSTIGDLEQDILNAIDTALSRTSIVLITGGIGPTKDDITKKTLCKYFNSTLVFDETVLQNIQNLFSHTGRALNELTKNQSFVPNNCTVIQNLQGTAPCSWFEKNGKILVSMPGVPYEMKNLMSNEIIPRLRQYFNQTDSIQHQTFWVKNFSESALALHIADFEDALPESIKLAYLPAAGIIRLRLTGRSNSPTLLSNQMEEQKTKLFELIGENIFSEEDRTIEIVLADLLKVNNLTLSTAESCTGGNIAHVITSIPGSSAFFKGSVVSYDNEVKKSILNVNENDLLEHGAVSRQVVEQMAQNVHRLLNTDCSIATSGIAGPGGGTPEKPVGTIWISVCYKDKIKSTKYSLGNNRENNIQRATNIGLTMLYEFVKLFLIK